ncbi:MAG: hypothetical protein ABIS43_19350 [Opitutus sp.]
MNNDQNDPLLLLLLGPVVLLALWAAFRLMTHRAKGATRGTGREDRTERSELTGNDQQKRRTQP